MLLEQLRLEYHQALCQQLLGFRQGSQVYSNADASQTMSVKLAAAMAGKMPGPFGTAPSAGQSAGTVFANLTRSFLSASFELLNHIRPGRWAFSVSQAKPGIAAYAQYSHLAELARLSRQHPELRAAIGLDYLITPDIVVGRSPLDDDVINEVGPVLDGDSSIAKYTSLRSHNQLLPIMHASISCKWTIRSDRAQNTRTEALNLIRNRKGQTPQVIVVTAEPLPSRIASIAIGTGDVDCTYHAALHELIDGMMGKPEFDYPAEEIQTLVAGQRLKDISDLPFDLAI
jgi:hypothetical protein